jgi:hypothetical protein
MNCGLYIESVVQALKRILHTPVPLAPHSYDKNLLMCANLHTSKITYISKLLFAMRSDEISVP